MTNTNEPKLTPEQIEEELTKFNNGTSHYYRNVAWSKNVHTDGVHWIAEVCQAYWLIDAIEAWQTKAKVRKEEFQVWKLQVQDDKSALLICEDGHEDSPEVCRQRIPYTDFPLKEIKFYFEYGSLDMVNPCMILMLPDER